MGDKINQIILVEQVKTLYTSMSSALVANVVASILLVTAQWGIFDVSVLLGWLFLAISIIFARLVLLIAYKRQFNSDSNILLWEKLFILGSSASGLMLGIAGVIMFPADNPVHQLICTFVLVSMCAGAISSLSVGRYSYPIYASLVLMPLIGSLLIEATRLTLVLTPMVLLAYIYILKSRLNIYRQNEQNIRLRVEAANSEQQMLKSQQKQILYVMNTPLAVIEWSTDFTVLDWNPAAETIFGYSREQAIGAYGPDLIVPEEFKSTVDDIWQSLLERKGGLESINQNIKADGSMITCEWKNTPLIDSQGQTFGVASTAQDISARIVAENKVIETNNMLQAVLNAIPVRVFWKDKHKKYLGCNLVFAADAGFSSVEEIIGKDDFNMPWKKQAQAYQNDDQFVMENDQSQLHYEETQTQFDGNTVYVETSKIPLKNTHGTIYGMLGTYYDITERKQFESNLIAAKEEAERANLAKSVFLSSMSHELRTPMNAILGFAQLIELDKNLTDELNENVKEILQAGKHLMLLINEVLDLSKIESEKIDLLLEPVKVKSVIKECLNLTSPLAAKHDIQLDYNSLSDPVVHVDRMRFKQALLNLLSNAVKYNRNGGSVKLSHAKEENQLCIKITDTGKGIPTEKLEDLFKPFNRLGEENGIIEGTGIGLSISQRIIKLMGGSIGVESEYGKGSTFWIKLPLES
jgi:PAS domain S-box-containing protein